VALMATIRHIPVADRNLILTGYTSPMQPAIGRRVAELLKMPFVNIDLQVEERNEMSIAEIRTRFGEPRLKTLEAEVVQESLLHRSAVIRIGGQTLIHGDYHERFLQTGPIICLTASLDSVLQNLHLMLGARYHDPTERALALGHVQREWAVRQLPNIIEIDTTYLTEEETATAVIETWQQAVL
jgi:shikimate kinase